VGAEGWGRSYSYNIHNVIQDSYINGVEKFRDKNILKALSQYIMLAHLFLKVQEAYKVQMKHCVCSMTSNL